MEATELVLQTMKEAGEPLNAGKIAELSVLDRKVVDKAFLVISQAALEDFLVNDLLKLIQWNLHGTIGFVGDKDISTLQTCDIKGFSR